MQTTWKNKVFGLEPYEELQSSFVSVEGDSQADALSPPGMIPSSTQISKSPKKSLFSRKPVRRTSTDGPPPSALPSDQASTQESLTDTIHAPGPLSRQPSSDASLSNPNRSIIPESLKELPSWYHTEGELAAATTRQFRGRYPIHNPVGPRFYKNVHLLPVPSKRPASVFSPSFPPMSTEPSTTPSPSRTPSGTPLPTPSSSETRIPDPTGKGRTRKISNVADNVDLLDASDPYGTNWHHESPYDGLGLNGDRNPVSTDVPDARPSPRSRSRMSTQPPGAHHRTTTPSPLSQSTSAVHLRPADQDAPPPVALTRKLTKQRKPFEGIFGSSSSAPASDTASMTPSVAGSSQTVTSKIFKRQSIFKSASTSSIASVVPSEKRQKHSSLLGRFARRLSIMRRPGHSRGGSLDPSNDGSRRQSLQVTDRTSTTTRPPSFASPVSPSENPQNTRIPPPQAGTTPSPDSTPLGTPEDERTPVGEQTQDGKRDSMSSLEVSYSIGRLTVVNPDVPSSVDNSPVNQTYPLPASRTAQVSAPLPQKKEKPLPPPVPPSSPVLLEVPKFESLSALISPPNGAATNTSPVTPTSRATPGEGGQKQSNPPSSFPVPIPGTVLKGERRPTASSPPSAKPIPASAPVSSPTHPSTGRVSVSAPPAIDDSPLSRASIIANPPTPYVEPTHITIPPVNEQAPASPSVRQPIPSPVITPIISSPHAMSPRESQMPPWHELTQPKNQVTRVNSSVRTRETETFHLVRNPSTGAVASTGQSIIVAGEQWDVVGGGRQRTRTKKEKEDAKRTNSDQERRDPKRQDRMTIEKAPTPASLKSESRKSRTKDNSSSRNRTSQIEGKEVRRSPTVPSPRVSGVPSTKPERRLSQSQGPRPTSELTPAAEMNALRAREVWEMDRLWKGRSVAYGLEGPQVVYAQSIGDVGSTTSVNGLGHGSSHTSYKLSQGFPFPTAAGVHSPPSSSSSSLRPPPQHHQQPRSFAQTMQGQGSMYDFPSGVRSYPDLANIPSIGSPESTPSTPTRNPLPAPPRQSTYRPTPLPASFAERDDSAAAEYWSKYAGVSVVSPTH